MPSTIRIFECRIKVDILPTTDIPISDNARRQADGGANVPNWSVTDLKHKPLFETSKLDVIYTDT